MRNFFKILIVSVTLLFGATACSADTGGSYTVLNPAQPTSTQKIEVLEFFFYGCSHCYHLHHDLSAWEKTMPKDVELVYVPVIFRDSWEPMARTFFALESLGQRAQLHEALYQAWNVNNVDLSDEAKILNFLAPRGVDRAKFSAAYKSFAMNSKVTRAKQMIRSYGINGTPTLVVEGKYVVTGLEPANMIRALNDAIAQARKDRKKK